MERNLWVLSAAFVFLGLVVWVLSANPQKSSWRTEAQSLSAGPELRLISERSSYMRTERLRSRRYTIALLAFACLIALMVWMLAPRVEEAGRTPVTIGSSAATDR
jgi:predicted nucleic acid-binding Zn ribbon protein